MSEEITPERRGNFICTECSSREIRTFAMVESIPVEGDPWSAVLRTLACAECGRETPAHLAERWNGISIKEAQEEWREVYRDS